MRALTPFPLLCRRPVPTGPCPPSPNLGPKWTAGSWSARVTCPQHFPRPRDSAPGGGAGGAERGRDQRGDEPGARGRAGSVAAARCSHLPARAPNADCFAPDALPSGFFVRLRRSNEETPGALCCPGTASRSAPLRAAQPASLRGAAARVRTLRREGQTGPAAPRRPLRAARLSAAVSVLIKPSNPGESASLSPPAAPCAPAGRAGPGGPGGGRGRRPRPGRHFRLWIRQWPADPRAPDRGLHSNRARPDAHWLRAPERRPSASTPASVPRTRQPIGPRPGARHRRRGPAPERGAGGRPAASHPGSRRPHLGVGASRADEAAPERGSAAREDAARARRRRRRRHEGADPGGRLRDAPAAADAQHAQAAGGLLQQAHPPAPGGGAGRGEARAGRPGGRDGRGDGDRARGRAGGRRAQAQPLCAGAAPPRRPAWTT